MGTKGDTLPMVHLFVGLVLAILVILIFLAGFHRDVKNANSTPTFDSVDAPLRVKGGMKATFSAKASDSTPTDMITLFVCDSPRISGKGCDDKTFCSGKGNNPSCDFLTERAEGKTEKISYWAFVADSYGAQVGPKSGFLTIDSQTPKATLVSVDGDTAAPFETNKEIPEIIAESDADFDVDTKAYEKVSCRIYPDDSEYLYKKSEGKPCAVIGRTIKCSVENTKNGENFRSIVCKDFGSDDAYGNYQGKETNLDVVWTKK
ncbi:MAG: hypothetical protein HZB68_00775 [Candidatus Aenigmarchaeota archaeon]|nr:hypothetical protein [Candidatus Aenigmarchaeota archaeon]